MSNARKKKETDSLQPSKVRSNFRDMTHMQILVSSSERKRRQDVLFVLGLRRCTIRTAEARGALSWSGYGRRIGRDVKQGVLLLDILGLLHWPCWLSGSSTPYGWGSVGAGALAHWTEEGDGWGGGGSCRERARRWRVRMESDTFHSGLIWPGNGLIKFQRSYNHFIPL